MANKELWQAMADGKVIEARSSAPRTFGHPSTDWFNLKNAAQAVCKAFVSGDPDWEFRIKPPTILINGIEVPEPLRVEPENGTPVWLVELSGVKNYAYVTGSTLYIERGLLHLTESAAQAHRYALLSCSAPASE